MSSTDRRETIGAFANWLHSRPRRYGFAVLAVTAAAVVRYVLDVALGVTAPYVLFYPTIMLIALIAGFGPGVSATLLSAAIAGYFYLEPLNSVAIRNRHDLVGLVLFAGMGVAISWVGDLFRRRAKRMQEFEKSVEGLEEMIVVVDRDYRYVIANRTFLNYRGKKRDDVIGRRVQELLTPTVFETTVKKRLEECFRGNTVRYEVRYPYPSLGERILFVSMFPIEGPGGVDRVAIVMRDVTDQKEAESSLKLFRTLIDQSNDAVEVIDPETLRFLDVNEKACKDLGYTREELLSMTVLDIDSNADESCHAAVMLELLTSGFVVKEAVHRRKDGSTLPVETSLKYVPLDKNYVVAVSRDISDRKRAADALRESQQRLTGIIASAMDAIITVDEQQRIVLFNAAAEKMFRCPEGEAMGQLIDRFIPQLSRAAHSGYIRQFAETRVTNRAMGSLGSQRALRADGQEFPIEASISQVECDGKKLFTAILRDVTERKLTEAELRESEERVRLFVDHAPAALAMFDREMRYLHASRRWLTDYGLDGRDIRGISHYEIFPDVPERWKEAHRRGLAGEVLQEENDHFERADGSARWIRWEIRPWRDSAGGIGGILIFTEDITERKHAEQLLRESEQNYRTLFDSMNEGFCTIEVLFNENNEPVDYRFLEVNPAFEKQTGITDARGRRMREIAPQHEEHWFTTYGKIALTGESARFENVAAQLHRSYDVHAFRVGEPQQRKVAIFFNDITERNLGAEALRRSEERFSKAFHNNPLAITITTEEEGRCLDVNDAFLDLFGYKRKDVIGRTAAELQWWGEPSDRLEMVRKLKEGKEVAKRHSRYRTAKGEIREGEVWTELIELDGQPCVLAITRDVTEIQQLEAQFRQAQKMEAVGRLAGGVAHDFNNILGIIMGYSDISLGEIAADNPASRYASETKKAAQRGALLTQQLLAFSRKQVVFPKILDLNDVVRTATKMFLRLVGEDIAVEFRPTVPLGLIKADSGQIEQVLMNLVVNARDAMPTGGKVIIETGHAEMDEHYVSRHAGAHAGQHVALVVSDTGCGMDETTKSQIFEPFFTTKEVGKGTGLGLSTVYGIVKQSAGYITVYSEPGKGTTFKIYFPIVLEKDKDLAPSVVDAEPPRGSETILVVEDEKNLREVTVTLLRQGGYRVLEAKDAEEALRIMGDSELRIDLLLSDVIMPGKSGAELARQAKQSHPNLRCLFMSGYTGDLVSRQGVVMEESSFLEKPFNKSSLLTKVYSVLHSESAK